MSDEKPLYYVSHTGKQFAVMNRAGERVSPFFRHRDDAEELCGKRLEASDTGLKRCLCCGTEFCSDGRHHRMCSNCRNRSDASLTSVSVAVEGGFHA